MTEPHRFTYRGHRVLLTQEQVSRGPVWVAWLEESELMYIRPATPGEHPHEIYHRVQDWIDRGMTDAPGEVQILRDPSWTLPERE